MGRMKREMNLDSLNKYVLNDGKEGYLWKTMKIVFTGNWINIR